MRVGAPRLIIVRLSGFSSVSARSISGTNLPTGRVLRSVPHPDEVPKTMRTVMLALSCLCGGALAFNAGAKSLASTVTRQAVSPTALLRQVNRRSDQQSLNMLSADKPLKIGVVGVTGAVGVEIIDVLGKRGFPVSELKLFASARSAGKDMKTPFGEDPLPPKTSPQ